MGTHRQRLVDTIPFQFGTILQESAAGRPMLVESILGFAGKKNLNGRVYPRSVWEKALAEQRDRIAQRGMLGEVDHPDDGETRLMRGSHIVTKAEIRPDGTIMGVLELLDTPGGLILQEYARKKARIGLSSRGDGSVEVVESDDGSGSYHEVQDDFTLETWDFVDRPSVAEAIPVLRENAGRRESMETTTGEKKFRTLREEATRLVRRPVALLAQEERDSAILEAERLIADLDRVSDSDAGYRSLAADLVAKLAEKRDALASPAAPPTPDKQLHAAEQIVAEMARRLRESERTHKGQLRALQAITARRVAQAEAGKAVVEKRLRVALAAGEEYKTRYEGSRVRERVGEVLSQPANSPLRGMRGQLLKAKSVQDVDKQVVELKKLVRPRSSVREGLPVTGAPVVRRVLGAPAEPAPLDALVSNEVLGIANDLHERLHLKY